MLVHSDDLGGSEGLCTLVVAREGLDHRGVACHKNLELGIELKRLGNPFEQHGRLAVGAHDVNADGGHLSSKIAVGARAQD